MVAPHGEVKTLRVRIGAAFNFTHAPPGYARRIIVLLAASHLTAVAPDTLRHVEVEAVVLAGRLWKRAGDWRKVRILLG